MAFSIIMLLTDW